MSNFGMIFPLVTLDAMGVPLGKRTAYCIARVRAWAREEGVTLAGDPLVETVEQHPSRGGPSLWVRWETFERA